MAIPLILSFPQSHHWAQEGKDVFFNFQTHQKLWMEEQKSASSKVDVFKIHLPGPRGKGTGTAHWSTTAEWSERGQGRISHEATKWSQDEGQPIRSMLEEEEPSGLSQVKAVESGCITRQTSDTDKMWKRFFKATELSREESKAAFRRSRALSKTALKSPHSNVGTDRSIWSAQKSKKSFLSGLRLGT